MNRVEMVQTEYYWGQQHWCIWIILKQQIGPIWCIDDTEYGGGEWKSMSTMNGNDHETF